MKLLDRIVRRFYSIEVKTSEQQLLDDFGEFPPTPLRCESLKGDFKVIRTRGIGTIYQDFVQAKALLLALASDPQSISPAAMNAPGFTESLHKMRDAMDDLFPAYGRRALVSTVFGLFCLNKIARGLPLIRRTPNTLGEFTPTLKNQSLIHILAGRARKLQKSEDPLLSHELFVENLTFSISSKA